MDPRRRRSAAGPLPLLDVLTTMSDPDLLLTIKERSEWGDPLDNQVGGGMTCQQGG